LKAHWGAAKGLVLGSGKTSPKEKWESQKMAPKQLENSASSPEERKKTLYSFHQKDGGRKHSTLTIEMGLGLFAWRNGDYTKYGHPLNKKPGKGGTRKIR